ncbi:hypothetical protein [Fodinicola feengrottensis]|uniref:Uncharacterized protein n=1 Tax=Fodinicola feengrottensis TaxID=435914 RepID=A0ABN2IAC8_9ACTN|nr:hypothetical protein [Fodinicola feengrottensis]
MATVEESSAVVPIYILRMDSDERVAVVRALDQYVEGGFDEGGLIADILEAI